LSKGSKINEREITTFEKQDKTIITAQMPVPLAAYSELSTRWDNFRTLKWDEIVEYSEDYFERSQQFLNIKV